MGHVPMLKELAIITLIGAGVTVFLSRFKLPTVAGLLAAGALLGPYGLGLVSEAHNIELLAEVGVVFLLFTIGLEFSFERMRHIFGQVALGGFFQVASTTAAVFGVAIWVGMPADRAVFYGFVVALSSTAIVLRALSERGELNAPHGRFIVGTLIFQDLCVVPMVLLVPILAGSGGSQGALSEVAFAMVKAVGVVAFAYFMARYPVPWLLNRVDASRSREVFLLAVLAICVGTAWATSLVGLSPALGAFLGGMVVADTEYQHRAMGDIIPLRDAFVSIFFISLGMLFQGGLVLQHPILVGALFLAFVMGKAVLAAIAAIFMRFPARAAMLAGMGLGQFGEFGFVLLKIGEGHGLTDPDVSGALLQAGILSMFVTPMLISLAPHLTAGERLLAPLSRLLGVRGVDQVEGEGEVLKGHVVVIGFGVAGRMVVRSLDACHVKFIVLELNADTVRKARTAGVPAYYADATSHEALVHAQVAKARAVAVLINDPEAVVRVVDSVRREAPGVPLMVRTRYLAERGKLLDLGASDVIAEEVEASAEAVMRLLRRLELPRNVIEAQVRIAREEMGTSDRKVTMPRITLAEHEGLAELKIDSVRMLAGWSGLGKSALEMDLRRITGASVVAVRRGSDLLQEMSVVGAFREGDLIYLVGNSDSIRHATGLLQHGAEV